MSPTSLKEIMGMPVHVVDMPAPTYSKAVSHYQDVLAQVERWKTYIKGVPTSLYEQLTDAEHQIDDEAIRHFGEDRSSPL